MDDNIYEVSRDEYAGLIGELKTDYFDMQTAHTDENTVITITSKATGQLITKRIINSDGEETYYIYTLPENHERLAPKKIRKYELQSREEVEAFIAILNQLQGGAKT